MEEYGLQMDLSITVSMDLKLFDSCIKQETGVAVHQVNILGQEIQLLRVLDSYDAFVLYNGDITTTSSYLIAVFIWIIKYYKINTTERKPNLLLWTHDVEVNTMLPIFAVVSLVALCISSLIGLFTNSFIIVAHSMDRFQGRSINPRELILLTLGLFNIFYQCTLIANDVVLFVWSDVYFSDNIHATFSLILLFTIFSSFWFTVCLCGFYCVNIVTVKHNLFTWLKQRLCNVVPWMLIMSVLISLCISIPVLWNISKPSNRQAIGNMTSNYTMIEGTSKISPRYLLVASMFGCCAPLILVGAANSLILKSLYTNAAHLRKSAGDMNVQSVEASVAAARTITALLILYFSFYLSVISLFLNIVLLGSSLFCVCVTVIYSYSPVQSFILIVGSPKLRSLSLKLHIFLRIYK